MKVAHPWFKLWHAYLSDCYLRPAVPKLGVNFPLGVICKFCGGNAEPRAQCCTVFFCLWRRILRVIRHNGYLDLGNGSKKFGNHCFRQTISNRISRILHQYAFFTWSCNLVFQHTYFSTRGGLHWNFLLIILSLACLAKVNVEFKETSIFGRKPAILWKSVKSPI